MKLRPYESSFNQLKRDAAKRLIYVLLTYEEYLTFVNNPCHYCLQGITWQPYRPYRGKHTINIDRKDSLKDYTLDNCVPCCTKCNQRKGTLSYESFKK